MSDSGGGNLIEIIFFLIFGLIWLIRQLSRKPQKPAGTKPDVRASAEEPEARPRPPGGSASASLPVSSAMAGPNPFTDDPIRASIYDQLNLRDTEALLQEWNEQDPEQWSPEAFEVMERILIQRLGKVPSPGLEHGAGEEPAFEPDEDVTPRIKELWLDGDLDGLAQALKHEADWLDRMDAAEALAAWGDARGYDFLVESLGDPRDDVREVARDILDDLPAAPGTTTHVRSATALTPDVRVPAAQPTMLSRRQAEGAPTSPGDIWSAYRQKQAAFEDEQATRAPDLRGTGQSMLGSFAAGQPSEGQPRPFTTYMLVGAVAGILVFLAFLAAPSLGLLQLETTIPGLQFLREMGFWLLFPDLVFGAVAGVLGGLLGHSLAGWQDLDYRQGCLAASLWSGLAGLVGAITGNVFLTALGGL